MKNGVLIVTSNNYSAYPTKVVVCKTEDDAKLLSLQLDEKFTNELEESDDDWYSYTKMVEVEIL